MQTERAAKEEKREAGRNTGNVPWLRLPAPLSRKETVGLLLIGGAILAYLLVRYGRFVDWGMW